MWTGRTACLEKAYKKQATSTRRAHRLRLCAPPLQGPISKTASAGPNPTWHGVPCDPDGRVGRKGAVREAVGVGWMYDIVQPNIG